MEHEFNMYRVLFYGRKQKYHPIHHISLLAMYIQTYGISSIRKIIFEITRSPYFPYSYHNIVLCNTGNQSFIIQFYHYYNSCNQLITLHHDIQYQDYYKLIQLLYHEPSLNTLLLPYIYPPVWNNTNDLKE